MKRAIANTIVYVAWGVMLAVVALAWLAQGY